MKRHQSSDDEFHGDYKKQKTTNVICNRSNSEASESWIELHKHEIQCPKCSQENILIQKLQSLVCEINQQLLVFFFVSF